MAYDELTAVMVKKNTDLEAQLATVTAERDEYRACNEHHKEQFLATNAELSRMRAERDQWRSYTWTEAVQFLADAKENLTQQYCNLQIMYGEQKHRIRDLEKELAQARQERDNWHQIVKDHCEEDEQFRKVAGEWDKSDSYGVEYHVDILERVLQQLHAAQARAGRLRDSIDEAIRYCEKDYGGAVIGKVLEEALKETP
jgi:chromosome segregation ATPase